jgi:hypothetical protein
MTAIRVTESTGSLGTIQVSAGDGSFLSGSLVAGSNVTITEDSGSFTIAASTTGGSTIGSAEDGDYTDGLFTDFTTETLIGVSIDRFNEVLKALAPAPGPGLDNLNSLQTGTSALLSFGSSNNQSSASPAYVTVASSAGLGAAVDVNGSYAVTTSSNNIRLGVFAGSTHISGVLNSDVAANSQGSGVQNFPAFSFGDGDTGVLRLNVNGSTIKEIDLTTAIIGSGTSGLGTGSHLNSDGSGFNFFSTPTTGTFSNGNPFNSFRHRTGRFVVSTNNQRNGWNYARVQHVRSGSTTTTNFIEWVNDNNNDALAATGNSLSFEGSGSVHLSGVEYFQSGSAQYKVRSTNAYKYVHDNNNITFTTSTSAEESSSPSFSISGQSKPTIGGSEDHNKILHITGSGNVTSDYFISGSLTAGVNVTHPIKSNLSNGGQSTTTGILMYNLSNTSTNTLETFRRENFRIISGAYNTQSSLVDAGNVWNSNVHMTASNGGHSNGLQFYNKRMYSPTNTLRSGDFRSTSNGGNLDNGPSENPNYSGISGQRTFYRWFRNTTGSTKNDLSITINGTGTTIVPAATALNSGRIRVFIKFPSNGTRQTGWLDLATEFVLDQYSDNAGAHTANGSLSFDNSLNATNIVTLGTIGVSNNEYIGLRIEADSSWTGSISQIEVTFGAGTGTITAIPDLDDIDCNDSGTDANLSFGSSKSITGYTNVGSSAGIGSAVDLNGLYETTSDSNNLRRAVFALSTIIEGDLNEDVSAVSPDFVANAFSDANSGSLVLEVNGSDIHTVELTGSFNLVGSGNPGSGTGTSFTGNSGFFDLSTWKPAEFDNEVPYFLEIQRTGKYRVHTSDQRNGWNYARVKHVGSWGTRTTNYVEWVNDNNADALASAGNSLSIFGDDSFSFISGVKYFNSPSGSVRTRISNLYKNVYSDSNSAISFTNLTNATGAKIVQSGLGLTSTKTTSAANDSLQTLNTSADSQNTILHATGTINFSQSKSLPGSSLTTSHNCAGAMTFVHPLKSNLTTPTQTTNNLLVWTPSDTSNANTDEQFTGEANRLVSSTYSAQSDVSGGSNNWNSQQSMNDQASYPEHATGLLVYDTYLISPKAAGSSGDFRNHAEGGGIESPAGNVNYSTLTNTTRDFFRGFLNNTTNDLARVTITLYGDAKIVGKTGPNVDTLGSNKNIFVELKIPGKTEFLDLGKPSAGAGNISSGDGCLFGDLNSNVDGSGETNVCTFNGQTVDGTTSGAEYFVIKISASQNWTGYLDRIQVAWSG